MGRESSPFVANVAASDAKVVFRQNSKVVVICQIECFAAAAAARRAIRFSFLLLCCMSLS